MMLTMMMTMTMTIIIVPVMMPITPVIMAMIDRHGDHLGDRRHGGRPSVLSVQHGCCVGSGAREGEQGPNLVVICRL
jgi:hypothetical protein